MSARPMEPSHEEIEGLIAAEALDALGEADAARLAELREEHGPACPTCRLLEDEYAEVAGALAVSTPAVPMSAGAEDRLMAAIGSATTADREADVVPFPRAGRAGPSRLRRRVAALAAAAAILVAGGLGGWALAPRGSSSDQAAFAAFVARAGTRIVAFPAKGQQQLTLAYRPGSTQAWLVGSNLPSPSGDHVYELWFRQAGTSNVQPAGTFSPKDGTVLAKVTIGTGVDLIAVSVEPPGGSPQPTTTPILVQKV